MHRLAPLLDRLARRLPGGPDGNRRLTASLGALLAVGLAAELGTLVLGLERTLPWHVAVGLALVPLVLAKLGSTGWRMLRYYTGAPAYRREGPPKPALRLLAPLLVGATAALFASGVALVFAPQLQLARSVHGASFALFALTVSAHVLAHLPKLRRYALADFLAGQRARGHAVRRGLAGFALVGGGALAVAGFERAQALAPLLRHFGG